MKKILDFLKSNFTIEEARFTGLLFILVFADQLTARLYTHRPESIGELLSLPFIQWYWFIKDVVCWTALLTVPFLTAGRYSRYIYLPFIVMFVLTEAATIFTWANFRMQLDGDWIGIVLGSSPGEFAFFVRSYAATWAFAFGIAFLGTLFYLVARAVTGLKPSAVTKPRIATAVSFLVLFAVMMPLSTAFKSSPSFFLFGDSVANWAHYKRMAKMKHKPKIPKDLAPSIQTPKLVAGVFILGESATRNHWSLYGYSKKTTPRMDAVKDELTIFTDVVTPVSNTAKAMELIFTHSTLDKPNKPNCTFAQMLKSTGFDVSLYSSQSRWGRWDGVESFIFAGASPLVFLDEEHLPGPWYDDSLLRYLDNDIAAQTNHMVSILHLRGSHFPAEAHYPNKNMPAELERFIKESSGPNADTNSYDTSIFFTDMLLGDTIERLKKRGGPAWMIYLSDHGDSIGANSWRLTDDPNVWEVPMIIWLSESYKKKFPEVAAALRNASSLPLQSDLLLAGFLHIAGVHGWEIGSETDFLSDKFKPRLPRLIEGGKLVYPGDEPDPTAPTEN